MLLYLDDGGDGVIVAFDPAEAARIGARLVRIAAVAAAPGCCP